MSTAREFQPVVIGDHGALLRSRMPHQFRDRPRLEALYAALGAVLQEAEELAFALLQSRVLETASGAALEQWGALVGEPRGALGDVAYRRFIAARMLANRSDGGGERLLGVWAIIMGPDLNEFGLNAMLPASYVLWAVVGSFFDAPTDNRVRRLMRAIKPGGVSIEQIEAPNDYFGFAGDPLARGFGEGPMARLV